MKGVFAIFILLSLSVFSQDKSKKKREPRSHDPKTWGYELAYGDDSRGCARSKKQVQLRTGEIYLQTTKKKIEIRSYGREFRIITKSRKANLNLCNYYKEDSVVYLTMLKGKAIVQLNDLNYSIGAGQYAEITDTINIKSLSDYEFNNQIARSWTKNKYYQFYNKPAHIIINRIARSQGLKVRYIQKPTSLVSGEIPFYKWTTIEMQLQEMTQLIKFEYFIANETLVIN